MSTSSNTAPTIAHILSHIDSHPGSILTKSQQTTYLKTLTTTHFCPYHSSTFGHTFHNETSLRKALTSIMATYLKLGVDVRPGKTAVDELFERGSEMLDEEYVQGVKSAAQGRVLQKRVVEESESEDHCSDEEHREDWAERPWESPSSGSDGDWEPGSKRTRAARKRRVQVVGKGSPSFSPPPAPKKRSRQFPPSCNGMNEVESPVPLKRPCTAVGRHTLYVRSDSEDSDCDGDTDDEFCNKRITTWRKSVQKSCTAETMIRRLSTLLEKNHLPASKPLVPQCQARKASVLEIDAALPVPRDLCAQVAELNKLLQWTTERYFADLSISRSADLVTRPTRELDNLYAQVFGKAEWQSKAVTLQSNHSLHVVDLLRSLISAFLFTRIFTKHEDFPWLSTEAILMLNLFKGKISSRLSTEHRDEAIDIAVASLFEDERLRNALLKPQAKKLASECLLTLNGHLNMLRRSACKSDADAESRLHEDLVSVCEQALRIQSGLVLNAESFEWKWYASGHYFESMLMQVEGGMRDGSEVALTLFPGVEWTDEKKGGLVPAVVKRL
ncbi:hypothetical protein PRZ48_012706 [Zasmidium cellare]|uniref:Uncharacterized protein n=1 Tax=Zasmidium cellare TaxID=395010 RepID=A0ABR0E6J9_ZASCE|nr:hypothetical protein PRZ48_012706 [Zasmidium cellare]